MHCKLLTRLIFCNTTAFVILRLVLLFVLYIEWILNWPTYSHLFHLEDKADHIRMTVYTCNFKHEFSTSHYFSVQT